MVRISSIRSLGSELKPRSGWWKVGVGLPAKLLQASGCLRHRSTRLLVPASAGGSLQ